MEDHCKVVEDAQNQCYTVRRIPNRTGGVLNEFAKTRSKWRRTIKRRDKYTCQHCGQTEFVEAHHIKSRSMHPEEELRITNGMTLCRECHLKLHQEIDKLNRLVVVNTILKQETIDQIEEVARLHGYSMKSEAIEHIVGWYTKNESVPPMDKSLLQDIVSLLNRVIDR